MTHATLNEKGFTLLEVLVALLILAIVLLGNLGIISLSYKKNVANWMLDEAVRVGQDRLEAIRSGNLTVDQCTGTEIRQLRGFEVVYNITCDYESIPFGETTVYSVNIRVSWNGTDGQIHNAEIASYVE